MNPSPGPASAAVDLRLARLHLRVGLHRIARAELETLAGSGDLDREGILDLAEARWRTGDLRGAGEAAAAYLALTARSGAAPSGPLAHVIVAEASASRGHVPEAEDAIGAALALLAMAGIVDHGVPRAIDALFAGIEPQAPWPEAALPAETGSAAEEVSSGYDARQASTAGRLDVAVSLPELLAEATVALGEGDAAGAGVALALVLRLDPGAAGDVVGLLDRAAAEPATAGVVAAPSLALVRGDALRAIGRDDLARLAYAEARPRARPAPVKHPDEPPEHPDEPPEHPDEPPEHPDEPPTAEDAEAAARKEAPADGEAASGTPSVGPEPEVEAPPSDEMTAAGEAAADEPAGEVPADEPQMEAEAAGPAAAAESPQGPPAEAEPPG